LRAGATFVDGTDSGDKNCGGGFIAVILIEASPKAGLVVTTIPIE